MSKLRNSSLFFFVMVASASFAQQREVVSKYINEYKNLAMAEMKRTGVPAAITLAQGIHESGAGTSKLVAASNNHFGIKCKSNWTGESVKHDDDAKSECFRKYAASEDSYKDHSDFLKNGQRYAFLFSLDPSDYEGWANGLKKAGYATNPKYPQVLIKLIEEYGLQDYTFIALGKSPDTNNQSVGNNQSYPGVIEIVPVIAPAEPEKIPDAAFTNASYPSGEFKINETKVVFVKKGISFLSVAKQYDVDLSKIFEFNEIVRTEMTDKDQLVYLQRKRKTGNNEFHVMQPGETLHSIAQQQAIRLESLLELNWLKKNEKPAVGEKLNLKSKSSAMPKLAVKENYSLIPTVQKPATN